MAEDKELDPTESDPASGDPADVDPTESDAAAASNDEPDAVEDDADASADVEDDAESPAEDELSDDELADDELAEDTDAEDEKELVTAGAASKTASTRSSKDSVAKADGTERKGRPTRKRDEAPAEPTRTGPVTFVKESAAELRKVVYPSGEQLRTFFIVVLVFVLFIIGFSSLLDFAFGWLVLRIFG